MPAWVYVLDTFKLIDIDVGEIARLAEEDPLELFNKYVRDVVEEELKGIDRVELYDAYFDPRRFELLIEYLVSCELGKISIKLIYSNKPTVTLQKYYEYEKQKR